MLSTLPMYLAVRALLVLTIQKMKKIPNVLGARGNVLTTPVSTRANSQHFPAFTVLPEINL